MGLNAARKVLQEHWGFNSFRSGQARIVEAALAGRDILALLPTGGGKSLCFQVPGMMLEGLTLVISPLIALMDDQVLQLNKNGIKAYRIHSGFSKREIELILDNCINGPVKFLYVSPERLLSPAFIQRLAYLPVTQLAIDEAHCISQWGHDFRPAYLEIRKIREKLPGVPVRAFTATATQTVRDDICKQLDLESPYMFLGEVFRPNLSLSVQRTSDRLAEIYTYCQANSEKSGIVYVRNRRACVEIATSLARRGVSAAPYHAGLTLETREKNMNDWLDGKISVTVATNAFGMGIDKSDVRYVLHVEAPPDLESYYQEAGRAGRDGKKSEAILYVQNRDKLKLEEKWKEQYVNESVLQTVYKQLALNNDVAEHDIPDEDFILDVKALSEKLKISAKEIFYAIRLLQAGGWIEWSDKGVNIHSTVEIRKSVQELRLIYQNHQWKEDLLSAMLRIYEGILSMPVIISEEKLGRHLNWKVEKVRSRLQELSRNETIEYTASSGLPTFRFLVPRVKASKIQYSNSKLHWLREWQGKKLEEVLNYMKAEKCLYQIIADYFSLGDPGPCGICSVCISRSIKSKADDINGAIIHAIRNKPMSSHQLVDLFGERFKEEDILNQVEHLLNQEVIILSDQLYYPGA